MKTLYLDCGMGAAGDMLTAALLELVPEKDDFLEKLNNIGLDCVTFKSESSAKCGINGTHITVKVNETEENEDMHEHLHRHSNAHTHEHAHHHSGMHEINHIIEKLSVSDKVKADVTAVYSLIAEAESYVHGVPVADIHFHEVGTLDAVADITAVCMLMEHLSPEQVVVSPINVGSGQVKCAHGILPVPAPATSHILKNIPIYTCEIKSELCTPTGAALLVHFATKFGNMPVMKTSDIGYGMGKKDFEAANCVRAFIGQTEDKSDDTVAELCCNLDDMTAEAIGFAQEQLLSSGALDVYTIPAQMKKSRPGTLLCVLCRESEKEKFAKLIFQCTTTLGVREKICRRYTLLRSEKTIKTDLGEVRKKVSSGYGITREKYEYKDLAKIAEERGINIQEAANYVEKYDKKL